MIKYHFFGKECLIDKNLIDDTNLKQNLAKQNFFLAKPAIFTNQIHSNNVLVVTNKNQSYHVNNRPKADAIVTNVTDLVIGIFTADCVPVILFDKNTIAIAHCGWRGALGNITKNTIAKMIKLGTKVDNIQAVIGPCIRQKSYQVSGEFYDNFLGEKQSNDKFFSADQQNFELEKTHFMFDLAAYVKEKLRDDGIKNIIDNEIDTFCSQEKFFSYRRSGQIGEKDCGRNVSVIQFMPNTIFS
jgi:hypothetical protein